MLKEIFFCPYREQSIKIDSRSFINKETPMQYKLFENGEDNCIFSRDRQSIIL